MRFSSRLVAFGMGVLLISLSVQAEERKIESNAASKDSGEDSKDSRILVGGVLLTGSSRRVSPDASPYPGYNPVLSDPFWMSFYAQSLCPGLGYPLLFASLLHTADRGEIQLKAGNRAAQVFVNEAYAGIVGDLRSFWLDPGAYDLRIQSPDGTGFTSRIYVLTGKTLKIDAGWQAPKAEERP